MFRKILVPLERGELASRAIEASIALARQSGAAISAFIAEAPVPPAAPVHQAGVPAVSASVHQLQVEELVRKLLNRFERSARDASVQFEGHFVHAHDVDVAIVEAAAQRGCDLIMMVTHDRGAIARLLLGSHTRNVIGRSPLPVLVVHEAPEQPAAIRNLLVPVDGGELSERAARESIAAAQALGASITAFIAEPAAPPSGARYSAQRYVREIEQHNQAVVAHAQGVLGEFERRCAAAGIGFRGVYAQAHQFDEAIAQAARDNGCDMIVMVTHGRGPFGELLFGSRTKGVMALSRLPLLVLH